MTAYYQTMQTASKSAVNMARAAGESTVNLEQIPKTSKAAELGLKALSIAGNMIVMWGISQAISIAASAWDHFNVTVKEVQENVDELTSNIKSLNAELDELKGKDSLTDAEQNRLKYLETRVDLEERLLKIEQTRLAQEQLGKSAKITDWFDDDSYVKKATKEFGALALDSSFLTNPGFNPLPFAFINGFMLTIMVQRPLFAKEMSSMKS